MRVSRRSFLAGVAAPLAARVTSRAASKSKQRVAVVGAGAFGGWIALQLRRMGADVTLVDNLGPGNSRSSSGGKTRVIRAIYGGDRIYSEMVKRAFDLWEELDAATGGDPLYVPMGALWMHRGDDSYVRAAAPILHDLGFPLDKLTNAEAAKRWPAVNFSGVQSVWFERRAGALLARRACRAVVDSFEKAGGRYRLAGAKPGEIANGSMKSLRLDDGSRIEADAYVFACGPWLGYVFPNLLASWVKPTRQEVYYFATPAGNDHFAQGRLPIWIDFGQRIVYGIPGIGGAWFKVADDTRGGPIDPSTSERKSTPEGVESARRFLAERFPELAKAPLLSAEVCQYENSPDGNLIIDRHPQASNVIIAGGGSGHGFKLAPVVGEMTAKLVLSGTDTPKAFHLDAQREARSKTQFQRS
jgi:glycine/D-amino acid oxidase-like deaminating enzyme